MQVDGDRRMRGRQLDETRQVEDAVHGSATGHQAVEAARCRQDDLRVGGEAAQAAQRGDRGEHVTQTERAKHQHDWRVHDADPRKRSVVANDLSREVVE